MTFLTKLTIRETDDAEHKYWEIVEPLTWRVHDGREYSVPPGFITNFASIPRAFWSVLPPWDRHMKAAVFHDYLYRKAPLPRKKIDDIFYKQMKHLGVSWWRRNVIYRAVRLFGAKHYNG